MAEQPTISTHVLDAQDGRPRRGVAVRLERIDDGHATPAGSATTDEDGRVRRLLEGPLTEGVYRLELEIGGPFFERLALTFRVDDASRPYHVPLLLAPYSLTTYRGS